MSMSLLWGIGALVLIFIGLPIMVLLDGFGPEDTLAKEDREKNDY